jgi:hypothetical protein
VETLPNNNDSRPYLSVVVTARNDDHGGNLLGRMQTFVNGLLAQAKRHAVPLELLVVDWNPLPERPPLIEALRWPADLGPVAVRFIEVPPALHHTLRHAAVLPLYQMIAKNVGIRRARGQFVLATNIDVLFSHELFELFAQRRLERGWMYRIDRHDAMQDVPVDATIDEQLRYCETHLIRVNTRQGSFAVNAAGQRLLEPQDIASPESGIFLGQGWYPLEGDPSAGGYRWVWNDAEIFLGPRAAEDTLILEVEPGPGVGYLPLLLRVSGAGGELLRESVVLRRQSVRIKLPPSAQPSLLRLRVPEGGLETAEDPRILNFRVFSLQWESQAAAAASSAAPRQAEAGQPLRRAGRRGWTSLPGRLRRLLSRLRSAGAPVQCGLPLPLFLVRLLKPQVQGSELLVTLDPRWFRLRRPRARLVPAPPRDIVRQGLDLLWGRGWYPQETDKLGGFRWARSGAEIILHTPPGEPAALRLQIEPGPAVGYGPFHLRVRDSSGNTIATAAVTRRQWIDLPLPWRPNRTQVFSLHARADSPPLHLPNDPRQLCFRVLDCSWTRGGAAGPVTDLNTVDPEQGCLWTPFSPSSGLLFGYGWRAETLDDQKLAWRAEPEAEIIIRQDGAPSRLLLLEMEPVDGEPIELLVHDGARLAVSRILHQREQLRIPVNLQQDQTGILRLSSVQPGASGAVQRISRPARLLSAAWEQIAAPEGPASGPPPGIAATPPDFAAPPAAARGAAFLHTNACGDFTLLAREHWLDLRGYPEFDLFSMNIDSVFCFAAHHGGAPEKFLADPMRVYHIEHATGSGFTPEGQAQLFARIAAKGLAWLSYEQVLDWAAEMRRLRRPMIFNGDDWGFAGVELTERTVSSQAHASASTHSSRHA